MQSMPGILLLIYDQFCPHIKKQQFAFGQITGMAKPDSQTTKFHGYVEESHAYT